MFHLQFTLNLQSLSYLEVPSVFGKDRSTGQHGPEFQKAKIFVSRGINSSLRWEHLNRSSFNTQGNQGQILSSWIWKRPGCHWCLKHLGHCNSHFISVISLQHSSELCRPIQRHTRPKLYPRVAFGWENQCMVQGWGSSNDHSCSHTEGLAFLTAHQWEQRTHRETRNHYFDWTQCRWCSLQGRDCLTAFVCKCLNHLPFVSNKWARSKERNGLQKRPPT